MIWADCNCNYDKEFLTKLANRYGFKHGGKIQISSDGDKFIARYILKDEYEIIKNDDTEKIYEVYGF